MSRDFESLIQGDVIQFHGVDDHVTIQKKLTRVFQNGDPPIFTFITNVGVFSHSKWEIDKMPRLRNFEIVERGKSVNVDLPDRFYKPLKES